MDPHSEEPFGGVHLFDTLPSAISGQAGANPSETEGLRIHSVTTSYPKGENLVFR
jgi:hypothetical protein